MQRRIVTVEGIIQGVGFRPFAFRTARSLGLRGRVRNGTSGAVLDVEGSVAEIDRLLAAIEREPPANARIARIRVESAPAVGYDDFAIDVSGEAGSRSPFSLVGPDLAACPACVSESREVGDRRHRYTLHGCTECGPRYTITTAVPYDRSRTAMAPFEPCEACRREYESPEDRRFHAQPVACPECGPRLSFRVVDGSAGGPASGATESGARLARVAVGPAALDAAVRALIRGQIVAVKGLGGYHLACDATRADVVRRLRERKSREAKPLAVMVRDLHQARDVCHVQPEEERLLESSARPIVLCRMRSDAPCAPEVAPGLQELGVMLPYTPLHHHLLDGHGGPLVMTSGNVSGEPIAYRDEDARSTLAGVADVFLDHDREIVARADDSVTRWMRGAPTVLRRSRGFAPAPLRLSRHRFERPTLGLGGHLKNTFCLATAELALLSPHVGDLETPGGVRGLRAMLRNHLDLFDVRPEIVAHDLHPGYATTRIAEELDVPSVAVQHHHAHVAACMAEHGVEGPVLGVAFDGAGLGDDGAIWGGELLMVDGAGYRRIGHLVYVPLPGGDAAAREPWRMACAHLHAAYGSGPESWPVDPMSVSVVPSSERRPTRDAWSLLAPMLERGLRSPPTSSMGRLFDAVAAILGFRATNAYEGQAAMELEAMADPAAANRYRFGLRESDGMRLLDAGPVVRAVARDAAGSEVAPAEIAGAFHRAIAMAVAEAACTVREEHGVDTVALTGGVFQNALLADLSADALEAEGLRVLLHREVPCNDGGLSLGQAVVASALVEPGDATPDGRIREPVRSEGETLQEEAASCA